MWRQLCGIQHLTFRFFLVFKDIFVFLAFSEGDCAEKKSWDHWLHYFSVDLGSAYTVRQLKIWVAEADVRIRVMSTMDSKVSPPVELEVEETEVCDMNQK